MWYEVYCDFLDDFCKKKLIIFSLALLQVQKISRKSFALVHNLAEGRFGLAQEFAWGLGGAHLLQNWRSEFSIHQPKLISPKWSTVGWGGLDRTFACDNMEGVQVTRIDEHRKFTCTCSWNLCWSDVATFPIRGETKYKIITSCRSQIVNY